MNRKLKRLVFGSFDKVYNTCEMSAKYYDSRGIPFSLYNRILEKAQLDPDTRNPDSDRVSSAFNKCLQVMSDKARRTCKAKGTEYVTLPSIKEHIDRFRTELERLIVNAN